MDEKIKVLFLCTGNSCRSQLAEALLRHHYGRRFEAYSAGTDPQPVNALTLQVLSEREIDTSALYSKHVSSLGDLSQFDYIITVCEQAAQNCPAVAAKGAQRLAMHFEDPAAFEGTTDERLAMFRLIRDRIEATLIDWVARLESEAVPAGTLA